MKKKKKVGRSFQAEAILSTSSCWLEGTLGIGIASYLPGSTPEFSLVYLDRVDGQ